MRVKTGLEKFLENPPKSAAKKRLGLLCNTASVDSKLRSSIQLIQKKFTGMLTAVFSPQHGLFAEKQDNMIESDNMIDPVSGLPVFSLYGKKRVPDKSMFDTIDLLLIDLQDAGTRVYTFIYTMSYCLEAAKKYGKKVILLDRPNPVNGKDIEGGLLKPEFSSFVGRYPIPMRYGLTIGETALFLNRYFNIGADLEIVAMENWNRDMYFKDTGIFWVPPSPNLPGPEAAYVYPGQVMLEGTNISEGRGTSLPFQLFGAPFIDIKKVSSEIGDIKGAILRPAAFEPVSNKWEKQLCFGFQIHITDLNKYSPYITTLKIIRAVILCHKDSFKWKNPPYEYEFEKFPIDLITGDKTIRERLEKGETIKNMQQSWQNEIEIFRKISKNFYLY